MVWLYLDVADRLKMPLVDMHLHDLALARRRWEAVEAALQRVG